MSFFKKTILLSFVIFHALFGASSKAIGDTSLHGPPEGVYLSFEERLLLNYFLAAYGETPKKQELVYAKLVRTAQAYLTNPVENVKVESFEEFLKIFRGNWPNTNRLDLDLKIIENTYSLRGRVFYSDKAQVNAEIHKYLLLRNKVIIKLLLESKLQSLNQITGLASVDSSSEVTSSAQSLLKSLSQIETHDLLNEQIHSLIEQLDHVGERIAKSNISHFNNPIESLLVVELLSQYFKGLSLESKKLIMRALTGEDLLSDNFEKFSVMIQNSGPQFQKLLQIMARQKELPENMREKFKELEDKVKPVSKYQVQKILERERQNYEFVWFDPEPLGVGTMAEVHRAKIRIDGQEEKVVVRFLKPDISDRIEEDNKILYDFAQKMDANPDYVNSGGVQLTPLVSDLTTTVRNELDLKATIDRQILAHKAYGHAVAFNTADRKSKLVFYVPKVFLPKSAKSLLHVQELIAGKKLDKEAVTYSSQYPEMKKKVVEELTALWLQETFYNSGFYHADLHQGNFLVSVSDPQITVNILDFGMGGVISKKLKEQAIILNAGFELMDEEIIADAFWEISDKSSNTISYNDFHNKVKSKVENIKRGIESDVGINAWTAWAINNGLKISFDFININRAVVLLNKLLEESGSHKTVSSIGKDVALKKFGKTAIILFLKGPLTLFDGLKLLQKIFLPSSISTSIRAIRCDTVLLQ